MSDTQTAWDIIQELAALFGEAESMDEMDASDFKDNAGEIWDLRQRAKELVDSQ